MCLPRTSTALALPAAQASCLPWHLAPSSILQPFSAVGTASPGHSGQILSTLKECVRLGLAEELASHLNATSSHHACQGPMAMRGSTLAGVGTHREEHCPVQGQGLLPLLYLTDRETGDPGGEGAWPRLSAC